MLVGVCGISGTFMALLTVAAKVAPVGGLVGAVRAGERFVSGVGAHVALQQVLSRRLVMAQRAGKAPHCINHPQVPEPCAASHRGVNANTNASRRHLGGRGEW